MIEGSSTTMKDFLNDHKERVIKKSDAQGRAAHEAQTEDEMEDEALAEYGFRSLTTLALGMIESTSENVKVTSALDCHIESFG